MTTIAYRDGIMAADSLETRKDFKDNQNCKKVWRLRDDSLFAYAGVTARGLILLRDLEAAVKADNKNLPQGLYKGIEALLVRGDKVWYYQNVWERLPNSYYALGTGMEYAMVAMDMGATAVEAVQ